MSRIPESPRTDFHLRVTDERIDLEKLKMFFKAINTEFAELLNLCSYNFRQRVLKVISKHPERFSQRFSLDLVVPSDSQTRLHYTLVARYGTTKAFYGNEYYEMGFQIKIEQSDGYGMTETRHADLSTFTPSGVPALDSFTDWAVKKINPQNPDSVRAYLYQGIQKASCEISNEIRSAMYEELKEEDGHALLLTVEDYKIRINAMDKMIADLKAKNIKLLTRTASLEGAIGNAIEEIAGTKNITKSPTLEAIRERLESALNEGEPKEEELCGAP